MSFESDQVCVLPNSQWLPGGEPQREQRFTDLGERGGGSFFAVDLPSEGSGKDERSQLIREISRL